MPVILANNLLKLDDLSPLIRNLNDGGVRSIKAGPQGIAKFGGIWWMFFEAVDDTIGGSGGSDTNTGPMLAKATQLQGPWTISPATSLLISPTGGGTWENGEFSPSSVALDVPNNRWIMWAHGGNNTGPRQVGVAYSTDGTAGLTWSKYSGNPALTIGSGGSFDESGVADMKIKIMPNGTYLGFYRGTNASGVYKVGRVTGTSPVALTKTGMVISNGGAGSWNEDGTCPGDWYQDPEGRIHMICVSSDNVGTGGCGYFYSDDLGVTWTAYASNPVLSNGAAGSYDLNAGDVAQGSIDGDVLFVTYGGENITDYPSNPPLRAIAAAITPARVGSPRKIGKFHLSSAYTAVTGASVLSQSTFSIMGRFRAFRLNRDLPQYRELYTEYAAFNIEVFCRIEGGSGADAGKLHVFIRTPTGICEMLSTGVVDDAAWHTFLVRRISAASWELYLDGTVVDTDATNISTDGTATTKAVGNWHGSTGVGNEPSLCTISDILTINGTAVTATEAAAIINTRTFPGGTAAVINFPGSGIDSGSVALVEAATEVAPALPFSTTVFAQRV